MEVKLEPLKDARIDLSEDFSFLPLVIELLTFVKESNSEEILESVRKLHDKFDRAKQLALELLPGIQQTHEEQQQEFQRLLDRLKEQRLQHISPLQNLQQLQQSNNNNRDKMEIG